VAARVGENGGEEKVSSWVLGDGFWGLGAEKGLTHRRAEQTLSKTQNPKPKTQNPKPKTQNPKPKTQNPKPKTGLNLKPDTFRSPPD
jgi:hypothetical protein